MRVFFLLLVLVNLLFFGWSNWIDRPTPRARAAAVPALKLAAASSPAEPSAMRCRSLGPYDDESAAGAAAKVLTQRGLTARSRRADITSIEGYLVYIFASDEAQQRRALRQLERAGLRDAAAINDEAHGRRVSAGLFSEHKRAEERAEAVRRAGLEPAIEERQKSVSQWWLDVSLAATAPPLRADDVVLAGGAAVLRVVDCP